MKFNKYRLNCQENNLSYIFGAEIRQYGYGRVAPLREAYITSEEEKLTDPFEYYRAHLGYRGIFRLMITHPDMDHMTGLARLYRQTPISNFWHTGFNDFNLADTTDQEWEDCRRGAQFILTLAREGARPPRKVAAGVGIFDNCDRL